MKNLNKLLIILFVGLPQTAQLQEEEFSAATDWEQEAAKLQESRQLWQRRNIQAYKFTTEKFCFGCNDHFPARLSVERDLIAAAFNPETGAAVEIEDVNFPNFTYDLNYVYQTVDELFVIIEEAIANHWGTPHAGPKASDLHVEYDAVYGFPNSIYVDYSRGLDAPGQESKRTDSKFSYRVSEFTPEP